ncbi:hypothetical protein FOCC_FOCC012845 [Frankliniella occidentalis]|nr:hypothetical protein FOCC_FOCC012845 [Frankliniella occidentalis]
MTRFPKDISKYKSYKASTWLLLLLYVSLIVLQRCLPEKYFQHWLLVVIAVHLLLQEVISEEDVELARLLLSVFVEESEELYGKGIMTYNLHGLQHMALMVKRWGALWSNSTFLFEDYNGVITRNLHGTNLISEEFVNLLGGHVANETLENVLHVEIDKLSSNPT